MISLNMHEMKILTSIMLKEKARYSELNIDKLPTNQFNYHLKLLLDAGYVVKTNDRYQLTEKGEDLAGEIDIFASDIERQGKISAVAVCIKEEGGVSYYLMQKRTKQPYYGYCGFPAGKIKYGHTFTEEVLRELQEETGLTGEATLKDISHILVTKSENHKVVNDFIFFKFVITNIGGELLAETIEGANQWMTLEQIRNEQLLFPGVIYTIEGLSTDTGLTFTEGEEVYKQSL